MVRALKVPFEFDPSGRTAKVTGEWSVMATYVRTLLLTRIGERVMLPTYGAATADSLFEALGDRFESELNGDIRDAIARWEPDVEIQHINFSYTDLSTMHVDLSFRVRSNLSDDASGSISVEIGLGGQVTEETG